MIRLGEDCFMKKVCCLLLSLMLLLPVLAAAESDEEELLIEEVVEGEEPVKEVTGPSEPVWDFPSLS